MNNHLGTKVSVMGGASYFLGQKFFPRSINPIDIALRLSMANYYWHFKVSYYCIKPSHEVLCKQVYTKHHKPGQVMYWKQNANLYPLANVMLCVKTLFSSNIQLPPTKR